MDPNSAKWLVTVRLPIQVLSWFLLLGIEYLLGLRPTADWEWYLFFSSPILAVATSAILTSEIAQTRFRKMLRSHPYLFSRGISMILWPSLVGAIALTLGDRISSDFLYLQLFVMVMVPMSDAILKARESLKSEKQLVQPATGLGA